MHYCVFNQVQHHQEIRSAHHHHQRAPVELTHMELPSVTRTGMERRRQQGAQLAAKLASEQEPTEQQVLLETPRSVETASSEVSVEPGQKVRGGAWGACLP